MRSTPEASASSRTNSLPLALALTAAVSALWYTGQRVRVPQGVQPVGDFDVEQYMGHWYELARIDYVFERGLTSCTGRHSPVGLLGLQRKWTDASRGSIVTGAAASSAE